MPQSHQTSFKSVSSLTQRARSAAELEETCVPIRSALPPSRTSSLRFPSQNNATRGCERRIKRCAGLGPPTRLPLHQLRMHSVMKHTQANTESISSRPLETTVFLEAHCGTFSQLHPSSGRFALPDGSSSSHLGATLPGRARLQPLLWQATFG